MIRHLTLVSLLAAGGAAGFLFLVAHQAQQRERELDGISKAIHDEREAVIVLEAEWAYLNRLERLQQLTTRHLDLAPMTTERIIRLQDLPVRVPAAKAPEEIGRPVPQAGARGTGERSR